MRSSLRSIVRFNGAIRKVSNKVPEEVPRIAIAKNMLLFHQILAAKDEQALAALTKTSPAIDVEHFPAEISYIKPYVTSIAASSGEAFKEDPSAWQNKGWWEYVVEESQRAETWPFLVGAL